MCIFFLTVRYQHYFWFYESKFFYSRCTKDLLKVTSEDLETNLEFCSKDKARLVYSSRHPNPLTFKYQSADSNPLFSGLRGFKFYFECKNFRFEKKIKLSGYFKNSIFFTILKRTNCKIIPQTRLELVSRSLTIKILVI